MVSSIVKEPIDLKGVSESAGNPESGAVLTFSGTVRNNHRGRSVVAIEYHAYESMAAKELDRLEDEIRERWSETIAHIVHRIGHLDVGEASVLIAVSSPHRAEGFEALRFAIDTLKERVPIWKKEIYTDGSYAWIDGS